MYVSSELKEKVNQTVNETVQLIEQHYRTKFRRPVTVVYDLDSARIAGQALSGTFVVRLNPAFLNKYQQEYIDRTVKHEVAHLGVTQVYKIDRRQNVSSHGPEWKNMMRVLGADASRCHSYQAEPTQGRQKTKYAYKCSCCDKPIPVGPKIHANISSGRTYIPKCCGQKASLVFVGVVGKVTYDAARTAINSGAVNDSVASHNTTTHKTTLPKPTSKLGKCYALYCDMKHNNFSRKQWIALFVDRCDCTVAGASTYLATCVKLYEGNHSS